MAVGAGGRIASELVGLGVRMRGVERMSGGRMAGGRKDGTRGVSGFGW